MFFGLPQRVCMSKIIVSYLVPFTLQQNNFNITMKQCNRVLCQSALVKKRCDAMVTLWCSLISLNNLYSKDCTVASPNIQSHTQLWDSDNKVPLSFLLELKSSSPRITLETSNELMMPHEDERNVPKENIHFYTNRKITTLKQYHSSALKTNS